MCKCVLSFGAVRGPFAIALSRRFLKATVREHRRDACLCVHVCVCVCVLSI